jgi:hypothetical protein
MLPRWGRGGEPLNAAPRIHADIERLIVRQHESDGVWNRPCRHFRAIDRQDARAALGQTREVIGKIEYDRVLAGPERLWGFPAIALDSQQVVEEHRLALEQVQPISIGFAAIGDQDSLRPAARNVDVGSDGNDRSRIDGAAPLEMPETSTL